MARTREGLVAGIESPPVVGYPNEHAAILRSKQQLQRHGVRMLARVRDRFLGKAEEHGAGLPRWLAVETIFDLELEPFVVMPDGRPSAGC